MKTIKKVNQIHVDKKYVTPMGSYMDVSENSGTPKSSILIGFFHCILYHPFLGCFPPIFGNTHMGPMVMSGGVGFSPTGF